MLVREKIQARYYFKESSPKGVVIHSRDNNEGLILKDTSFTIYHDELNELQVMNSLSDITIEFLQALNNIDILIIGTGEKQAFPDKDLYQRLATLSFSVDFMNNNAACRTYNILLNEERKAAVLILFPST